MDDPTTYRTPLLSPQERNRAILEALYNHDDLKTVLFVCGEKLEGTLGKKLLRAWDEKGHILGNHSFSHFFYHSPEIDAEAYIKDIQRGEAIVKEFSNFRKLFRFPFLKEGDTAKKRDAVRAFLTKHGYRVGHATIDASDWYIDQRMRTRLERKPNADLTPYRDFYLDHIRDRATYYDDLSKKVLGHSVRHTLLIHHNLLNALFLGDLLNMFDRRGWQLIDAGEAFKDPVFSARPDIIPAGESILWALAKETGKSEGHLRYPGEDGQYEKDEMDQLGL
ncbi:MAG: polysaccharide deacetylase family protein [Candidatus Zixiibacteriota bacterium]|nr:MAG: polysaccharide deacetylase family protein [candidate division Zixibacteria bacterium]